MGRGEEVRRGAGVWATLLGPQQRPWKECGLSGGPGPWAEPEPFFSFAGSTWSAGTKGPPGSSWTSCKSCHLLARLSHPSPLFPAAHLAAHSGLGAASGKSQKEMEARGSSGASYRWVASPGPGLACPPFRSPNPASQALRACPSRYGPGSSVNSSPLGFAWDQALRHLQRTCHPRTRGRQGPNLLSRVFPSEHR